MAQATITDNANASASKPKNIVLIEQAKCKGCELCVVSCPRGCLELAHDHLNAKGFHPVEFVYEGTIGACTGCATCFIVCPDGAITAIMVLKKEAPQ